VAPQFLTGYRMRKAGGRSLEPWTFRSGAIRSLQGERCARPARPSHSRDHRTHRGRGAWPRTSGARQLWREPWWRHTCATTTAARRRRRDLSIWHRDSGCKTPLGPWTSQTRYLRT